LIDDAYPTSCSPQAWAAASSRLVLRSLLRFNPDIPMVPKQLLPMRLENVPLAGSRVSLTVHSDGGIEVSGLPAGVRVVTAGGH
jgi:hypothetical protein